jgi:glycosyltransferase involved in cell wall biosynthesis
LLPYLQPLAPTLLTARAIADFNCYPVPGNLTPAQGKIGHLRRLWWTQFRLPQIYRKLNAALLFSPLPEAPLYSGCRFVVMVHDLIPLRFPNPKSFLTPYCRYVMPQVLAQAAHILCNSEATARDIGKFYGIPAEKITPIPLAYHDSRFRPLAVEKDDITPYFLYLGRHDPHKNLPRLIAAFAQMGGSPDCQLWLAGPGDSRYTPQLQGQVAELGLQERVKFLNYVPDEQLPLLLNRALALVFPTLWEGFGLPLLEAMACGTPAVAANLGAAPEVTGKAALLVNPYEIKEIAAAMAGLLRDAHLRSQLRHLGLQRASQFSWAKTGEATREVLAAI